MRLKIIDVIVVLLLLVVSVFIFGEIESQDYFGYDEADYMYAVSQGVIANYVDQHAISLISFVKQGFKKGMKKEETGSLSEFVRKSDDITFYRHYHGPLYFYSQAFSRFFFGSSEHVARFSSFLYFMLSVVFIYGASFFLIEKNARLTALFSCLLFVFSSANFYTAAQITPHGMYVFMVIVTLVLLAKLLQTTNIRYLYYIVISLALSFMVIEYALLLFFTVIVCLFIERKQLFEDWSKKDFLRYFLILAGLFLCVILVVWPGGLLKLSLLKNYLFFTYFVFFRGSSYGEQSFWQVWLDRFTASPVIYTLILLTTIVALSRVKHNRWYMGFLVYSFLIFITTFRNTSASPTYISSLLPPLFLVGGIVLSLDLSRFFSKNKTGLVVTLIFIVIASSFYQIFMKKSEKISSTALKDIVTFVKNEQSDSIFIDRDLLPTFHYYMPERHFSSYSEITESYESIVDNVLTGSYDGVLYEGDQYAVFENNLKKHFSFETKVITVDTVLKRKALYYKFQ